MRLFSGEKNATVISKPIDNTIGSLQFLMCSKRKEEETGGREIWARVSSDIFYGLQVLLISLQIFHHIVCVIKCYN